MKGKERKGKVMLLLLFVVEDMVEDTSNVRISSYGGSIRASPCACCPGGWIKSEVKYVYSQSVSQSVSHQSVN